MEKETKVQDKKIEGKFGKIVLPKIDVSEYIGKKVKIESADVYEGEFGYYLKVETKVVETLGTKEKPIELRGSKILGLQQDEDGTYGYGEGTKLDLFMKKYKADKFKDLVGKEVVLQTSTSKTGTDFLSFN